MNYGLIASVLVTVDQRSGEWVSLPQIAQALSLREATVAPVCATLADRNQVLHAHRDGVDYYGIRCEGVTP